MDEEFVTSRGKVIVNGKRLLIQNFKVDIRQTARPLITLSAAIISFVVPSKAYGYLITAIVLVLFFSSYFKQLYIVLFKKSYSNYIPVNRIFSMASITDEFGLETEVRLHLRNGRYRSIILRTLKVNTSFLQKAFLNTWYSFN